MRILIKQFLGKLHSWSVIGWGLADAFIEMGHEVDLFSTDGIKYLPKHLEKNLIGYHEEGGQEIVGTLPNNQYDVQYSYTAIKNFPIHLQYGDKNRFGQWCYEWVGKNILPSELTKFHKYCDLLCAPSNWVKNEMFISSGIPKEKIIIIPHGINVENYKKTSIIPLPTEKKFKILVNYASLHKRKNVAGVLESYGKAFSDKDDVCLIIKAKGKKIENQFEIDLSDYIKKYKSKYNAEVKIYSEYLPDISSLYRSVDCVYSLAHGEGFNMPLLEGLAAGKSIIATDIGSHKDFCNESNSFLIKAKIGRCTDPTAMYWKMNHQAGWIIPDSNSAIENLQLAYKTYEEKNKIVESQRENIYNEYNWKTIANKILEKYSK